MAIKTEVASGSDAAPGAVVELAGELLTDVPELAAAMAEHLHAGIPELGGADHTLIAETRASCASNLSQSLRLMAESVPLSSLVVTPEAMQYLRSFIGRGLALPVLLRTYRLGHAWMWEHWSAALHARIAEPQELASAVEFSSRWMFSYIDLVSAALVEDFAAERARMVRSADQRRALAVQAVLRGEADDASAASAQLGYELARNHVALHVFTADESCEGLEAAARRAAAALDCVAPLLIASGPASFDVWCPLLEGQDGAALDQLMLDGGVLVGVGGGSDAAGIEGFRRAHAEAREAARVRLLAGDGLGSVVEFREVELAALLSADAGRAERFVHHQLGDLATGDEPSARLRETLLAYLSSNRSATRAAKELFVHQNTVSYRVARAEEILGHPVADRQVELLCALVLAPLVIGAQGSGLPSQPS